MSKGPKKQHFVPRCYLSEFVDKNLPPGYEPYVWVFDKDGKNKRNRAPNNLFTENHLYTIKLKSGKKEFVIEKTLSAIENKFAQIFKQKINLKKPLSGIEHSYLCTFVAAQLQRTLRFKRQQENFIQQIIDHGKQIAVVHGIVSKEVQEWENYKKNIHKIQLVEGIPLLAQILIKMNLAFLCSRDINSHWFITSDDPCVLFNPDLQWQKFYGPAFSQKNVQLVLSLSPEIAVMFSWANYTGYSYLSNVQIEDTNIMIRAHSDKEFISPNPKLKRVWLSNYPMDPIFLFKIFLKKFKIWSGRYEN